ncbi:MAG: Cyclic pyranopterin monophosphate synthase [Syntrophorhabdaceae bacterium PtaU1.Bin034]|nr:MAG: Cyclic pyranopterin monophosphate synthase [Syntrophorhabdaceae bacterium PtaU1.Bin034]
MILRDGGPGFSQFAVTNVCNASCRFCNFSLNGINGREKRFVDVGESLSALKNLYRNGIRYIVVTGGEPLLHPCLEEILSGARVLGMTLVLVTNAALLSAHRLSRLIGCGVSSFLISIDAADPELHESHRGLPGVCRKIEQANHIIRQTGLRSTASVTMSRLLNYDALPPFLEQLGFSSVSFSYPVTRLDSSYLSFSDSDLVTYSPLELIEAFERVERLKTRIHVVNPTESIQEMKRLLRGEKQRYACYAGYKYFYLDWNLDLWRCQNWSRPLCPADEFDGSQRVFDGCTRCMLDCYRDSSVMHHIGVSIHNAYQSLAHLKVKSAVTALMRRSNMGSIRALMEDSDWVRHL